MGGRPGALVRAARPAALAAAHAAEHPLAPGIPLDAARAALGLPDRRLVEALAAGQLSVAGGVLRAPAELPARLQAAVRELRRDLAAAPFLAPEAGRLAELGLSPRELAAAGRAGLLLRVSEQIVLAPGADEQAAGILAGLAQPFTTAQARQALGTDPAGGDPAAGVPGPGRRHRAAADDRRRAPAALSGYRRMCGRWVNRSMLHAAASAGGSPGRDPAGERDRGDRGHQDAGAEVPRGQPGVVQPGHPVDDRAAVGVPGPEAAPLVGGAQPAHRGQGRVQPARIESMTSCRTAGLSSPMSNVPPTSSLPSSSWVATGATVPGRRTGAGSVTSRCPLTRPRAGRAGARRASAAARWRTRPRRGGCRRPW